MTDYTDELFALRLGLQDHIFDESRIIKELKLYLLEKNESMDSINKTILEFYKKYNIDFSEDFITNISIPQINMNSLNNLIAPLQMLSNLQNISLDDEDDDEDDEDDEDDDEDGEDDDEDDDDDDDDIIDEAGVEDDDLSNNYNQQIPLMMPVPPNMAANQQMLSAMNQLFGIQQGGMNSQDQLLETLTQLLNMPILQPPPMEDVKTTLDDSDLESLEVKTASKDMDTTCSVCMTKILKDNKYIDLPCKHTFHESCISTWLKEYNYKCPVCRKECGKPKYDI